MFSRNFLKAAVLTSLMMSPAAKAVDFFGYFTFDYSEMMTGDTGATPKKSGALNQAGNFENQFLALMIQHETGIYKFFSEIEFMFGPELVITATPPAGGSALDSTWGNGSGIILERAYVDAAYSSAFNMRMGKSLAPLLWKANHYPNIVKPITMPTTLEKKTLPTGFIGPMIYGKLGGGFNYNLWTGRSAGDLSNANNQSFSQMYRLAYEHELHNGNFELSFVSGNYANGYATTSPMGADLALNMGKFTMWGEYSQSGEGSNDINAGTGVKSNANKKLRDGGYVVLSYAMDIGGKEFTPFFFYDTYGESDTGLDIKTTSVGFNYRVAPTVEHKLEYSAITQSDIAKSVVDETRLNYQFVYFFN